MLMSKLNYCYYPVESCIRLKVSSKNKFMGHLGEAIKRERSSLRENLCNYNDGRLSEEKLCQVRIFR